MSETGSTTIVENFRSVAGLSNVFRSASTDGLGTKLMETGDSSTIMGHDRFILDHIGLIIDLRSAPERKEIEAQVWMHQAGIKTIESDQDYHPTNDRCVVRIDVLSKPNFLAYIEGNWFTPQEKLEAELLRSTDWKRLRTMRIEKLNEQGLAGLNEAILETGKDGIRRALEALTLHLETNPRHSAMVHCVQGKDRTGMVAMLLQSIMNLPDELIVADYVKSNEMLSKSNNTGSAAVYDMQQPGKLANSFFAGTFEKDMIATLKFLRLQYGSVSPGYLDAIGFDPSWRNRLAAVLIPTDSSVPSSRSKM